MGFFINTGGAFDTSNVSVPFPTYISTLFLCARPVAASPIPAGGSSELTLKPMSPFLQQRQAIMRKMKVKRPEKETATTARDEGHDSSLSGAPSATSDTRRVKSGNVVQEMTGDEGDMDTHTH